MLFMTELIAKVLKSSGLKVVLLGNPGPEGSDRIAILLPKVRHRHIVAAVHDNWVWMKRDFKDREIFDLNDPTFDPEKIAKDVVKWATQNLTSNSLPVIADAPVGFSEID